MNPEEVEDSDGEDDVRVLIADVSVVSEESIEDTGCEKPGALINDFEINVEEFG